jgi:hypothetical protein
MKERFTKLIYYLLSRMNVTKFIDTLKSGDLLLFEGSGLNSKLIKVLLIILTNRKDFY